MGTACASQSVEIGKRRARIRLRSIFIAPLRGTTATVFLAMVAALMIRVGRWIDCDGDGASLERGGHAGAGNYHEILAAIIEGLLASTPPKSLR